MNSTATSEETALPECQDNQLDQLAADNEDHNIITLDGKNTLHIMSIIHNFFFHENQKFRTYSKRELHEP